MPATNQLFPIQVWKRWYPQATGVPGMELMMKRWDEAETSNDSAIMGVFKLRDWYQFERQNSAPDAVQIISNHGHSWLLTREWKELPLEPYFDETAKQHWRSLMVAPTLREFRGYQAQFVGGMIETIASNSTLFHQLIKQQLETKLAELQQLASLPIEEYYTPEIEDDDSVEYLSVLNAIHRDMAAPFELREQLACFGPGFEVIRANMLDINPELNLPNIDLLNESLAIDLGAILRVFQEVDPKLKAILRNYAQHDYFQLEDPAAPDSFWWRHWKRESKKQAGKHSSRPSGHKPKRGERR